MITSALTLLSTLITLTLLFTMGCGVLLCLRRGVRPPAGNQMRLWWAAVLLLSLIPLRLFTPTASVTVYEQAEDDIVRICIDAYEKPGQESPSASTHADTELWTIRLSEGAAIGARIFLSAAVSVWVIGFALSALSSLSRRMEADTMLRRHSRPCPDGRVLDIYRQCGERMGMPLPPLRVLRPGLNLSPCCAGVVRPTVYIASGTTEMSEDALSMIFTHELAHLRGHDPALSVLCSVLCAIHWMNPLVLIVRRAVEEDGEIAADETVLRLYGEEKRLDYIHTILDVAAACTGDIAPYHAAIGRHNGLRRRYEIMRHPRSRIRSALGGATAVALCFGNIALTSLCALPAEGLGAPPVVLQDAWLASALGDYFGISPHALTEEHLAQVQSIQVRPSSLCQPITNADGQVLCVPIEVQINGDSFLYDTLPREIPAVTFDAIRDAIARTSGKRREDTWCSFYCLNIDGRYILDPGAKPRELTSLLSMLYEAGVTDLRTPRSPLGHLPDIPHFPHLHAVCIHESLCE